MITHLLLPNQRRTSCMRLVERLHTTDSVPHVTCKVCLRRHLQTLALKKALLKAKGEKR